MQDKNKRIARKTTEQNESTISYCKNLMIISILLTDQNKRKLGEKNLTMAKRL